MADQVKDQVLANDPLAQAEDPSEIKYTNEYWGEVLIDAFFCVLEKGVGKVPFSEQEHDIDRRLTAVKVSVMPVPAADLQFSVDRDYIAEFRDWNAITLPSLKSLNVRLAELNGKFTHVKLTETGETYVNKMGETKEKTVFEFLTIYETLEEAEEAYIKERGGKSNNGHKTISNNPVSKGGEKEKVAAEKFLEVAVKSAVSGLSGLDTAREAVAEQIAKMPMISKHFTVDSEETMKYIAQYLQA